MNLRPGNTSVLPEVNPYVKWWKQFVKRYKKPWEV